MVRKNKQRGRKRSCPDFKWMATIRNNENISVKKPISEDKTILQFRTFLGLGEKC